MTDVAEQLRLSLPKKPQAVDIEAVRRQPSLTKAIVLCVDLAGFANDKDLCRTLDLDPAVWARIKSGQACFPQEKLSPLMDEAGNEVPLIWLADRRGYLLTPKETEMQKRNRELSEALEDERAKTRMLTGILQGKAV